MQQKHTFPQVDGERVKHIMCNLACKRDGVVPHHKHAKYSELESMVVEQNGYIEAMVAEYGKGHCEEIVNKHAAKMAAKAKAGPLAASVKTFIEHLVNEMAPDADPFEMPLPEPGEDKNAYSDRVIGLVQAKLGLNGAEQPIGKPKTEVKINSHTVGGAKEARFGILDLSFDGEVPVPGTDAYKVLTDKLELQMVEHGVPADVAPKLAREILEKGAKA